MGLKVKHVESHSIAERMGIRKGDEITAIDEQPLRDIIDFQYYSSEDVFDLTYIRDHQTQTIEIERSFSEPIGLIFEPFSFHYCGNRCVFCFTDQNPKGMRKPLYFKDEDYRLSFLDGNYVTLTTVSEEALDRIVEQRLSPLYISIHATQPDVRKKLLGIDREDHLLEKIKRLADARIEMHGQIVLCPGINDGPVLEETLTVLSRFYPALLTMAVVPVGLTKHRDHLPQLDPVTPEIAEKVIGQIETLREKWREPMKSSFVFLSDEFYLMSGKDLPTTEDYGEFWQIENGVGMVRALLDEFESVRPMIPKQIKTPRRVIWITGEMIAPIIERHILPGLNSVENLTVLLHPVKNEFYGPSVHVTGLLTGRDIVRSVKQSGEDGIVFIPAVCLNEEGVFLDDYSLNDIQTQLGREARLLINFEDFWS